jgi:hypothetical protein
LARLTVWLQGSAGGTLGHSHERRSITAAPSALALGSSGHAESGEGGPGSVLAGRELLARGRWLGQGHRALVVERVLGLQQLVLIDAESEATAHPLIHRARERAIPPAELWPQRKALQAAISRPGCRACTDAAGALRRPGSVGGAVDDAPLMVILYSMNRTRDARKATSRWHRQREASPGLFFLAVCMLLWS